MGPDYDIRAHGDAALLVVFGDSIDRGINDRVHAAAAAVRASPQLGPGWHPPIPSYASLLVSYDALRLDYAEASTQLEGVLGQMPEPARDAHQGTVVVEIATRYGGDAGPDLEAVAQRTGLTPAQVVELHSSVVYRAYMLGFAPGFAYLGELPAELELPRLLTPRQRVPAGSVAIAGRQTAVYPLATPGGWHLIGGTDAVMWDVTRFAPALIGAGDEVRFVPRA